jgi:hypothetical protein
MISMPNEGAAVCIAPSCPGPAATVGSRSTATRRARGYFLEQRQPFPPNRIFEDGKPGDVAAGPGQTFDEAGTDRIADGRKHDWYGTRCLLERSHSRASGSDQNIGREYY